MSLLMDALRRAEEAKRQAAPIPPSSSASSPGELTLAPLDRPERAATNRESPLPSLATHREALDAELAAAAEPPVQRKGETAARARTGDLDERSPAAREAARNVFAAKQPAASRTALWLFLGLVGIAALGIGGFVWWRLHTASSSSLARPPATAAPPAAATDPRPAPPAVSESRVLAAIAEAVEALPTNVAAATASPPPAPARATPGRVERPRVETAGAARADVPPLLQRRAPLPPPDTALERAYEAWLGGRLDEARRAYQQVLRNDGRNTDALLGLAAIAAREGQPERAADLYRRVLENDPGEVTAQAELINLRGAGDGQLAETRLKTLLASQPETPALHFALGNLYARQGRWNDAQQQYFDAHTLDAHNADFLFNLAVSLDQLRQTELAAQYYRAALTASATRPAAFSRSDAERRLLELQRAAASNRALRTPPAATPEAGNDDR